jgi:hypothetical protein
MIHSWNVSLRAATHWVHFHFQNISQLYNRKFLSFCLQRLCNPETAVLQHMYITCYSQSKVINTSISLSYYYVLGAFNLQHLHIHTLTCLFCSPRKTERHKSINVNMQTYATSVQNLVSEYHLPLKFKLKNTIL